LKKQISINNHKKEFALDNVDIIYHLVDLTADHRRKVLLTDETKEGLINLVSDVFKKPIFKLYIKDKEIDLLEEKLKQFKIEIYKSDINFRTGDFLMTIEKAGEL
jgi:hypothetical protein